MRLPALFCIDMRFFPHQRLHDENKRRLAEYDSLHADYNRMKGELDAQAATHRAESRAMVEEFELKAKTYKDCLVQQERAEAEYRSTCQAADKVLFVLGFFP